MPYCSNCGSKLKEGAKFCSVCGEPCDNDNINNEQDYQYEERKQRYAGDIIKCPACGHEIKSSEISESLKEFTDELDEIDWLIMTSIWYHFVIFLNIIYS